MLIVNILGSIDDKIENNENLYKKLEDKLKLIYHKYFSKNKATESNVNKVSLVDIAEFIGGYSYKGEELVKSNYGLITIKNFDRNIGFKLDGFKDLSNMNKAKAKQYVELFDIVVAHTDLTQNAEIIGNAEIVLNKNNYEKLIASMDLVIVRPKDFSKYILYILVHNSDFKNHALGYCAGTTVLHLNKRALNEYVAHIPTNNDLLNKLEKEIKIIVEKQYYIISENQNLNNLKQLYLKKFFG